MTTPPPPPTGSGQAMAAQPASCPHSLECQRRAHWRAVDWKMGDSSRSQKDPRPSSASSRSDRDGRQPGESLFFYTGVGGGSAGGYHGCITRTKKTKLATRRPCDSVAKAPSGPQKTFPPKAARQKERPLERLRERLQPGISLTIHALLVNRYIYTSTPPTSTPSTPPQPLHLGFNHTEQQRRPKGP